MPSGPPPFATIQFALALARKLRDQPSSIAPAIAALEAAKPDDPGSQASAWALWQDIAEHRTKATPADADVDLGLRMLVETARSKAHASEILSELAQGPCRPEALRKRTSLRDQQIHRVLAWADEEELVRKYKVKGWVFYRATNLAQRILWLLATPKWLSDATIIARAATKNRVLGTPVSKLRDEIAAQVGLDAVQVSRALESLTRAMSGRSVSHLAPALQPPGSEARGFIICPIVYPRELDEEVLLNHRTDTNERPFQGNEGYYAPRLDALGEAYVHRAIARAGLDTDSVVEWRPQAFAERSSRSARPVYLRVDRPIISLSSPLANPVTLELLLRFGSAAYFDHRVSEVLRCDGRESFYLTSQVDYGLCSRFVDNETGHSHFVLAGLKPSGTYAACRFFYESIERLLEKHGGEPFTYVVKTRRGYDGRKEPYEATHLDLRHPNPPVQGKVLLDMRYIDALPLIADTYLREKKGRTDFSRMLDRLFRGASSDVVRQLDVERLVKSRDHFTYELARDIATVLTSNDVFEWLLVELLARTCHRSSGAFHQVTPGMQPTAALRGALDSLHLAHYTRRALERLIRGRHWVSAFLRVCATGEGHISSLDKERSCQGHEKPARTGA